MSAMRAPLVVKLSPLLDEHLVFGAAAKLRLIDQLAICIRFAASQPCLRHRQIAVHRIATSREFHRAPRLCCTDLSYARKWCTRGSREKAVASEGECCFPR